MLSRPLTYRCGESSLSSMVKRMSNTRFQQVGLGTSPCPVPLCAENDSIAPAKVVCVSGVRTLSYPCFIHAFRAWFDFTTVTPSMSISASHSAISRGTPTLRHAILIRFLDTESNALCISQVSLCSGVPLSIASSSMLRCWSIAVKVPLSALYPCCDTLSVSCLLQTACSLRSTHLLQSFLSTSTSMIGRKSSTLLISAVVFFANAFNHLHFHSDRYCFRSQHALSPSYVFCRRSSGQCLS